LSPAILLGGVDLPALDSMRGRAVSLEPDVSTREILAAVAPDLSTWPAKPEAARLLGIGERTLDRMVKLKGYPEVRMRPRDGRKPEPVVNPDDLRQMLAGRHITAVMPPESAASVALAELAARPVNGPTPEEVVQGAGIARVLKALAGVVLPSLEAARDDRRLWLGLKMAAQYSGLSMVLLQRLCAAGRILAVKDTGWKIQRRALDELGENLAVFLKK
jgi:hypothetical protein